MRAIDYSLYNAVNKPFLSVPLILRIKYTNTGCAVLAKPLRSMEGIF